MNRRLIHLMAVALLGVGSGAVAWSQTNQVLNPEFDDGLTSWGRYGAAGYTASVVTGAHLSGPNAALMDITDASVTSIGLAQGGLKFERGKTYPVGFMAKADKPREMVLLIQLAKPEVPSWTDIVLEHVSLTTEPKTFLFEYTHNDDNTADHPGWAATLYLMAKGQWWPMTGDTVPSRIWVDRVHVGPQPPLADSTIRNAQAPQPANGATDVPRDVVLQWRPGDTAGAHDVYLGKTLADVNTAGRSSPNGVLVSQGQTTVGYSSKDPLEYGQTYYWRVDEINQTPDNTIFKGSIWSFTVEPYAYRLPGASITATASSSQPGLGPENTINGSGLTGDLHSNTDGTMWMTLGALPAWIQYQFDAVYKLDKLLVWNCNQMVEPYIGFGAKDVTIEYSVDGTTWTTLPGVPPFAQATGLPGYAANTTVDFSGVLAQYVKLTINKTWGGMAPTTGLSEVRFSYIPLVARAPQPATGSTGAALGTVLSWRPGREATSHQVYFGTDPNAVAQGTAAAQTVTDHSCTPASLALGTKYYWRVDEVGAGGTYAGPVWSFTTQDYLVVEDFEAYDDDQHRIYESWLDGFDNPSANGGVVGNNPTAAQLATGTGHFAETTIIHGGKQAMPFFYDNTAAPLSEAVRTLDQNWTTSGVKSLSLWFRGVAGNKGNLYVKINKAKITYAGAATDIAQTAWQPWNIDLSGVAGLNKVTSLTIGVEGAGAKGTLYVDDIRLYPKLPQFVAPVQPDQANLAGWWKLDETSGTAVSDASGNGMTGSFLGAPKWAVGKLGGALQFDGTAAAVSLANPAKARPGASLSITCWANPSTVTGEKAILALEGAYVFKGHGANPRFTTPGVLDHSAANATLTPGTWQHLAITFQAGTTGGCVFYVNGVATDRMNASAFAAAAATTAGPLLLGNDQWSEWYGGLLDDVRLYNRILSAAEVAGLSGRTEPLALPF